MPTGVGHTLRFQIDLLDGPADRRVQLFVDGAAQPIAEDTAKLSFEGPTKSALAAVQEGNASEGQVKTCGMALWERLRTGAIGQALESLRRTDSGALQIRLALQPPDDALPWEVLRDDHRQRLAASNAYVLVRHPDGPTPAPRARSGELSLLVVAPSRTMLRVEDEVAAIRQAFEHHGVAVQIDAPLFGRVTVETLRDRLTAKLKTDGAPYEILHFIGHGVVGTDGVPRLQLNDEGAGEHEIPPSSLAALLQGDASAMPASAALQAHCAPRLVVLNACHSGAAAEARGLAGFGQELLSAGVQAVVAMRCAIYDNLAIHFAVAFYREIARTGRVDAAVTVGRQWLHQKQQADTATVFSIPVLFEASDVEPVFEVSAAARPATRVVASAAMTGPPNAIVPETLVTAVLSRWCVPVLGSSLHPVARDGGGQVWTPGTLAESLANKCQFPEHEVVTAMSQLRQRLDHILLQRVCEHFVAKNKRPPLYREIKAFVGTVREVPKIYEDLSSWPVPGFVCSHFDGFLTRAFEARGRAFRAITSPDKPAPTGGADSPLIVQLRGSIADDSSLRLTGADHDRLLDAMMRMDAQSSAVSGLVAAYSGTCLLLLGATAWDPWLRHLLWRMVPRDSYENNTLYIVQPHPTDADRAAWGGFTVEWIEAAPEDVVAVITERIASPSEAGR